MTVEDQPAIEPVASGKPARRVLLRVALGLLLGCGMCYGWLAMSRQKARKQAEAVEALRQAGANVYLDYQWSHGHPVSDAQPPQAAWLQRLVGADMLDRAVAVDLRQAQHPDLVVRWLRLLPYLTDLNAGNPSLTDQAVETLQRLASLSHLDLSHSQVTDQGVARLVQLPQLVSLSLAGTHISDACLATLGQLRHLRELDLTGTQLSEEVISRLALQLPKCRIKKP